MSTPVGNEAVDRDSERDTSPPAKVTKFEWKGMRRQRKHLDTVCSQGSERSDDDFCAGDAGKRSVTDSDQSDSPAAESDRLTPVPKFRCDDSDSSDEMTRPASGHGDLLKNLENITDSSDSSQRSPEHTEYDESNDLLEHYSNSPPNVPELPESSEEAKTPCFSQADRVATLRKRMAVYSPSDSILSPCTMKLNRPKNFFRMRQAKASSLLSAEELSEENDGVEMEDTTTVEVGTPTDDEANKTGDEDTTFTESQEGSDHDDF
ncbi:unnamed protein product [Cercopithifilaria johnstoni]|uniref:Uncharacterized protein n=1 Tax=Cercopithifilaria johnstoni TaxID=2874296 RepID=A0A8J2MAF6_9BILA|nr:unnamed protein product [Cercopithifilaria johnstoni]